jgi:hypothetical protein
MEPAQTARGPVAGAAATAGLIAEALDEQGLS